MIEDGLRHHRKAHRSDHLSHLPRGRCGELIQLDGSDHRWFEDRALSSGLLVLIDDTTSRLQQMRFMKFKSTFSHIEALDEDLRVDVRLLFVRYGTFCVGK